MPTHHSAQNINQTLQHWQQLIPRHQNTNELRFLWKSIRTCLPENHVGTMMAAAPLPPPAPPTSLPPPNAPIYSCAAKHHWLPSLPTLLPPPVEHTGFLTCTPRCYFVPDPNTSRHPMLTQKLVLTSSGVCWRQTLTSPTAPRIPFISI